MEEKIERSPEHEAAVKAIEIAVDTFHKALTPYAEHLSIVLAVEYKNEVKGLTYLQPKSSTELVLSAMVFQLGVQEFLKKIVGHDVTVSTMPLPESASKDGKPIIIRTKGPMKNPFGPIGGNSHVN